jgi:hypothetical protein
VQYCKTLYFQMAGKSTAATPPNITDILSQPLSPSGSNSAMPTATAKISIIDQTATFFNFASQFSGSNSNVSHVGTNTSTPDKTVKESAASDLQSTFPTAPSESGNSLARANSTNSSNTTLATNDPNQSSEAALSPEIVKAIEDAFAEVRQQYILIKRVRFLAKSFLGTR